MKKIGVRACSVLLIAALVIVGLTVYVLRYIDNGRDWALYFSGANSGSTGQIIDKNGVVLASFSKEGSSFAPDALTREANYHVTGDYWGRSGTGLLSSFWGQLQGFNLLTGVSQAEDSVLRLNIDSRLDNAAYQALDGRRGAVLLCDYTTGRLRCMVSGPAVDPADPDAVPQEGAYINRCLSSTFVPGSVFKLVTAAAAIENIPGIEDETFICEGKYTVAGVDIVCSGTHYEQTFEQALANSCNVAFSQLAIRLGQDTMVKYVKDFGLIDRHELDGITTAAGAYPTDFVGDPELGWSGIGQSTDMVNPFALLRFVSAIANGGLLCEISMISDDRPPKTERLLQADTAARLKRMMSYNVAAHYGGEESFPGLDLCAKTGTAELGDGTSHAWFVGFLDDAEHPYAFVTFIEQGGGGLTAAGALANTLLQAAVRD